MKKFISVILSLILILSCCFIPTDEVSAADDGILTIAIDAGHGIDKTGGYKTGAKNSKYSIYEDDINFTIAKYLVEMLNQYSGVKAFLTRKDQYTIGLEQRVINAVNGGADVFISCHNNASENKNANYATVYVPNENYKKKCGTEGKALGESILVELEKLGLPNNGAYARSSETNTKYKDGSLADYYAVIKHSKERGIPGIIIEHAFLTNNAACKKYFMSDESLKELAAADCAGIVNYYKLSAKTEEGLLEYVDCDGVDATLSIQPYPQAATYNIYRGNTKDSMVLIDSIKKDEASPDSYIATPVFDESGNIIDTIYSGLNAFTYKDKNLQMNQDYCYQVVATLADGTKYNSNIEDIFTTVDMDCEARSTATGEITVSWEPVTGVQGYSIYRSDKKASDYIKIATVKKDKSSEYVDTTATATNHNYFYEVRAYQTIDGKIVRSDYSPYSKAITLAAPAIKSIKQNSKENLTINWSAVAGAGEYIIYRSNSDGEYEEIDTVEATSTKYVDKSCEPGIAYTYQIKAVVNIGSSENESSPAAAIAATLVAQPETEELTITKNGYVNIAWEECVGATGYELLRADGAGSEKYVKIADLKSTATSYKDKNVKFGQVVSYKIRALNNQGIVSGQTAYYFTEEETVMPTPQIKSVVKTDDGTGIKITWKKNAGVTGYYLYRSDAPDKTGKKIKTITSDATTSYIDTAADMSQGSTVCYSIKAYVKTSSGKVTGFASEKVGL